MEKCVVVYSGGLDSFTLLHKIIHEKEFDKIYALNFNYGQKHEKETLAAVKVCRDLDIPFINAVLPSEAFLGSSLTGDKAVPEGHYEDESMRDTYVPNRNMVMLSIACSYALSIGAKEVFYGAHSGDHAIYPDCRENFLEAVNKAVIIGNYGKVIIRAPFMDWEKWEIVNCGLHLGIPYEDTWTCYNGREKACGKCGSCVERLDAFERNGRKDPMEYEYD